MSSDTLQANLNALDKAVDEVAYHGSGNVRSFYHALLMKCAARMSIDEFTQCVEAATAQTETRKRST